jgi:hypothetical protein
MSEFKPAPTHFYTLPDDILRVVVAFVPTSELIVLVRCSRRLMSVLHDALSHRLDDLFVVLPSRPPYYNVWKFLPFVIEHCEFQTLFGDLNDSHFIEPPSCEVFQLNGYVAWAPSKPASVRSGLPYAAYGPAGPALDRFVRWLKYRVSKLRQLRRKRPLTSSG